VLESAPETKAHPYGCAFLHFLHSEKVARSKSAEMREFSGGHRGDALLYGPTKVVPDTKPKHSIQKELAGILKSQGEGCGQMAFHIALAVQL
jgi:hypothetical protein